MNDNKVRRAFQQGNLLDCFDNLTHGSIARFPDKITISQFKKHLRIKMTYHERLIKQVYRWGSKAQWNER